MKILSFVLCVMLILGGNAYGGEGGKCPKDTISTLSKIPSVEIGTTGKPQIWGRKLPKNFLRHPSYTIPTPVPIPGPYVPVPNVGKILETHCGVIFSGWRINDQKVERLDTYLGLYYSRYIVWEHFEGICSLKKGHSGDHHGAISPCGKTKTTTEVLPGGFPFEEHSLNYYFNDLSSKPTEYPH